jgi:hypothetical protein
MQPTLFAKPGGTLNAQGAQYTARVAPRVPATDNKPMGHNDSTLGPPCPIVPNDATLETEQPLHGEQAACPCCQVSASIYESMSACARWEMVSMSASREPAARIDGSSWYNPLP